MVVYVINKNGNPLMPCRPSKARKLLRDGKAKCIRRTPFTIQLNWDCEENVQELILGIDSGSKVVGTAVRDDENNIYYLSEVNLRQDIKSNMDRRRMYRRTRRSRKTRYRKCRFSNRCNSTKSGRYSPSIMSKFNSLNKEIKFIKKILPIKQLIIETGSFDTHALSNPSVINHPWLYSKGLQFGFNNIKQYILSRDNYECKSCKGKMKDKHLHIHHIIERSNGGSDLPNNLITLCKTCHDNVHKNNIKLNIKKIFSNLKHATHMNILQSLIRKNLDYIETYGYITKTIREYFGLDKTHYNDAICVDNQVDIIPNVLSKLYIKRCISKGKYQLTWGKRSEKKYPTGKICGFKTF
ncbi:MAG: RNA-guided endonuclease IscB, partial [Magnetococcus sp. YQC-3]